MRIAIIMAALMVAATLSGKSPKRGVCWDEHAVSLNETHSRLLQPGVSWCYNWGPSPAVESAYGSEFCFIPMAWNGAFDESRIRAWLAAHPESKYLLGFNEPNFSDQANMTPSAAASVWPRLEKLAADFGVKLVAPALNFSASKVGGRIWSPYEWYDEFFRLLPEAHIDCLALHCYMNWFSSMAWFATGYFYEDLYNPAKECYGQYPSLKAYLDRFKALNGDFPHMMLTEFCAWENDGTITDVDYQIDQMTRKVQLLEQSDLVDGYAWFMANPDAGAASYPYMGMFEHNTADSPLSQLGVIYVNMSDFDRSKFYAPDRKVAAKDYVDATIDANMVRVRIDESSDAPFPLLVEIPAGGYPTYQIDVPRSGGYKFELDVNCADGTDIDLYIDLKKQGGVRVPANGSWTRVPVSVRLEAGHHELMVYNSGQAPLRFRSFEFAEAGIDGIGSVMADTEGSAELYTLDGRSSGTCAGGRMAAGVYLLRTADSVRKVFLTK